MRKIDLAVRIGTLRCGNASVQLLHIVFLYKKFRRRRRLGDPDGVFDSGYAGELQHQRHREAARPLESAWESNLRELGLCRTICRRQKQPIDIY